jgi:hypothetical protein
MTTRTARLILAADRWWKYTLAAAIYWAAVVFLIVQAYSIPVHSHPADRMAGAFACGMAAGFGSLRLAMDLSRRYRDRKKAPGGRS